MNERITQLWRQVELQECDCGCNPDEFLRLKFAQALVKECADQVDDYFSDFYNRTAADKIKEHFGVEEGLIK